jgi:hypothetical protein
MNAADRESRWSTALRLAISAREESEARAVGDAVVADLGIPVLSEPRYTAGEGGTWFVRIALDLSVLATIEPDDVQTRFSFVAGYLEGAQTWSSRVDDARKSGQFEWPPSVWEKQPGRDDELLHPAIRAARIEVASQPG